MSTPVPPPNPDPPKDAGPEQIQDDIGRTREEPGETVEALAARLDFKAQARNKADSAKARAGSAVGAARKRISDTAASTRGRLEQLSREAAQHAPTDRGQRARLIIASGVAGGLVGVLMRRACTRTTRARSAAIAVKSDRGTAPFPARRHQGTTGQPRLPVPGPPGKSPKSSKPLQT